MGIKRKMIISLIILFILILINQTISFARYQPEQFGLIITDDAGGTEEIKNFGADILGIIRVVGTLGSVGIAMVLGIKYMLGSTEERAEYKKTLLPYLIGAVVIFSATNLANWIYEFATGNIKKTAMQIAIESSNIEVKQEGLYKYFVYLGDFDFEYIANDAVSKFSGEVSSDFSLEEILIYYWSTMRMTIMYDSGSEEYKKFQDIQVQILLYMKEKYSLEGYQIRYIS